YRDPLTIAGWSFAHEVAAGVMGRPCSSPAVLLKNALSSTIVGHKHTLEEGVATRIDGTKVHAIIAGCYVHPRAREDWNRNTAHLAWNGVLILRDAENGECGELRRITQAQLKRVYS